MAVPAHGPFDHGSTRIVVVTITPAIAADYLANNNGRNRSLNNRRVEGLARDILAGRWEFNGDAIRMLRSMAPAVPSSSRSGRSTTIRTPSVGATFQEGGSRRASSATEASAKASARSWASRNEA